MCRGEIDATEAFLEAYQEAMRVLQSPLPQPSDRAEPSFRAMCFTLLHDQDILSTVLERNPELWRIPTLEALQRRLWGFLDSLI